MPFRTASAPSAPALFSGLVQPRLSIAPAGEYSPTRRGQNYNPGYGRRRPIVLKNTPIVERVNLQIRVDFFNVFNRTNLAPAGFPIHRRRRDDLLDHWAIPGQPGHRPRRTGQRPVIGEDYLLTLFDPQPGVRGTYSTG